jgi:predicted RNA polymerase sigma factor
MSEALLRELAPRALAVLARRFGDFERCEDAVQEALLAAHRQWPAAGVPDSPLAWLVTVASRRWTEMWRNEAARGRRERAAAALEPRAPEPVPDEDDGLTLLLLCCHPVLTMPSKVALTLRAAGGLTTGEIARGLLVPEATVGQRISRAKTRVKDSGASFALPPDDELSDRVTTVLHVLYLIFNEGYTASSGARLNRVELSAEAIRLTRQLHTTRPRDGEITGLLALMLLTDARRPARTHSDGTLVPLAEQDRTRWDAAAIAEGTTLVEGALACAPLGPYQLQAAIAAVHDQAAHVRDTDWPQILGLYELLHRLAPGPMVSLNRVVAIAMVQGPEAGLAALHDVDIDPEHHRVHAVRAHLLDLTGDHDAARAAYQEAARRTLSVPEQQYLRSRAS